MLVEEQRIKTILTAQEMDADIEAMIASLTPDEAQTLQSILNDPHAQEFLSRIRDVDYERTPVDPREFFTNPYFFGQAAQSLYPKLLDDIEEIFLGGYEEAIFSGSIGYGKTFCAACILCYMLYQISCLREPQRTYGIDESSFLTLACISVNLKMAKRGVFAEITSKFKNSPYFSEEFLGRPMSYEVLFPKNINIMAGSTGNNAIIGMNVFGGIIDEANFYGHMSEATAASRARWGIIDRVSLLYDAIKRRMKSRFMKAGKLPGILVITSSATVQSSFTAQKMLEARDNPKIFCRDYSTFDIKPKHYFSGVTFQVSTGGERLKNKILGPEDDVAHLKELGAKVFDVPIEYRGDFERNLEGATMEILGVSVSLSNLFLPNIQAVLACFDLGKGRRHPFSDEIWGCGQEGDFEWGSLVTRKQKTVRGGYQEVSWEPLVNPGKSRHVHLDLSKNGDATGVVVAHVDRYVEVPRRNPKTGNEFTEMAPVVWVDLALRVVAPAGGEIILGDVRSLVYAMKDHGFSFSFASSDQFQSQDTIQKFRSKGIHAELVSVDKKMEQYESLKLALYEKRVNVYPYQPLLDELSSLQKKVVGNRIKVDHPDDPSQGTPSKDVADALAAVVWSLTYKYSGETLLVTQEVGEKVDDDRLNLGIKLIPIYEGQTEGDEVRLPFLIGGKRD